jgi:hypothetical protein
MGTNQNLDNLFDIDGEYSENEELLKSKVILVNEDIIPSPAKRSYFIEENDSNSDDSSDEIDITDRSSIHIIKLRRQPLRVTTRIKIVKKSIWCKDCNRLNNKSVCDYCHCNDLTNGFINKKNQLACCSDDLCKTILSASYNMKVEENWNFIEKEKWKYCIC